MLIEARAKINWSLDITGVRPDGYHLMDMLMQPVTLCDRVTLLPASELTLTTGGSPLLPPDEKHLAIRAARALQKATGAVKGASIHVHKTIPVGAGMGGGSADAAAVLWGLNRLWDLNLSLDRLMEIGLTLGADVPFCLHGGLGRTTGIGEKIEPLSGAPEVPLVVIQPCDGLSTKEIFSAWNKVDTLTRPDTDKAVRAFAMKDLPAAFDCLNNVMQPISEALRPQIGEVIRALKEAGATLAVMTGSGSAVFGVFSDRDTARKTADLFSRRWEKTWCCETCREPLVILSE